MPQTGPKSGRGKAISRRNALKHGIHSVAPVVGGIDEDPREWERHRVGMIDSLEPENHLEIVLVERLANLLWRITRLERYETEMIISLNPSAGLSLARRNGRGARGEGTPVSRPSSVLPPVSYLSSPISYFLPLTSYLQPLTKPSCLA